jgi:hypothetical protein
LAGTSMAPASLVLLRVPIGIPKVQADSVTVKAQASIKVNLVTTVPFQP